MAHIATIARMVSTKTKSTSMDGKHASSVPLAATRWGWMEPRMVQAAYQTAFIAMPIPTPALDRQAAV
jgi:hypothetical protein